ncbi:syndecan-2 isoform 1-T2 [Menidia menidia]
MRTGWAVVAVALCLCRDTMAQAAKPSSQADDLYLEDPGSGGYYPEDDDDFSSGSGSGGGGEAVEEVVTVTAVYEEPPQPTQDSTKALTPRVDAPTVRGKTREGSPRKPFRTEAPVPVTENQERNQMTFTTGSPGSPQEPIEVRTENLFQRTEVLAAVVAGGVIGFLFAIFLILLLVYRMRKKDEGSYDLGERKPSSSAYQKAPTKEFYA